MLNASMSPIICVGESLEQREAGVTAEWIALQVKSALNGVPAEKLRRCIIAYEPIWAIGTGKTPRPSRPVRSAPTSVPPSAACTAHGWPAASPFSTAAA